MHKKATKAEAGTWMRTTKIILNDEPLFKQHVRDDLKDAAKRNFSIFSATYPDLQKTSASCHIKLSELLIKLNFYQKICN